jgi:cytochrome c-type biogenesis protein CcmH
LTIQFSLFALSLLMTAVALIVLLPRFWRRDDGGETNADWLRLRQSELEGESATLREEAALRFLEEGEASASNATVSGAPSSIFKSQLLIAVSLALGVWFLYRLLGGWEDVQIAKALESVEQSRPEEVLALISRIESRASMRPQNMDYSLLLAEYYLSGNDPAAAQRYFDRLIDAGAAAPDILGKAAQAEFLSSNRALSSRAQSRAEQALALDPSQSAALATLGMAAFETSDFRQAIFYWQRLRELEPPGSQGYVMLTQVIERARQELGAAADQESDIPDLSRKVVSPGVIVEVSIPATAAVSEDAAVFVLARQEGADSGMPIAVARVDARVWPLTVNLDDNASMAGQRISDFATVSIEVQVSRNGQPGRDNAVLWSRVDAVAVGDTESLSVVLGNE